MFEKFIPNDEAPKPKVEGELTEEDLAMIASLKERLTEEDEDSENASEGSIQHELSVGEKPHPIHDHTDPAKRTNIEWQPKGPDATRPQQPPKTM